MKYLCYNKLLERYFIFLVTGEEQQKLQQEYLDYQKKLEQQKADYRKEHPDEVRYSLIFNN